MYPVEVLNPSTRACAEFSSVVLLCSGVLACSGQQATGPRDAAAVAPAAPAAKSADSSRAEAKRFAARARDYAKNEDWKNARTEIDECIERDPDLAECHELLGDALLQAEDEAGAARSFARAIELQPTQAASYSKLAELYLTFKRTNEAGVVLGEGIRLVPAAPSLREALLGMNILQATVAERTGDAAIRRAAAERAEGLLGEGVGVEAFEVGRIFATLSPPQSVRATRLLTSFQSGTCKGAKSRSFRDQCVTASLLLARLEADASSEAEPSVAREVPKAEGGVAPRVPVVDLAREPTRQGDAYTVWGAAYFLRSARHRADVTSGPIAVTGYIVKTNLSEMPKCAVHAPGIADPVDCRAPLPTFWLGDSPDAPEADCIPVLGWASNPAQIHEAIRVFDRARRRGKPAEPVEDAFWGTALPDPLPARGARVTVTATYGEDFTMASSGLLHDEVMGFLTYRSIDTLEPAQELGTLPGVTRAGAGATR